MRVSQLSKDTRDNVWCSYVVRYVKRRALILDLVVRFCQPLQLVAYSATPLNDDVLVT